MTMIKNYIKIAIRNLLKYKGFSFINITGLAIGITCCILILLFVQDELSYDKFNEKYGRIYRVWLDINISGMVQQQTVTCAPLAETMMRELPEVESAVRIRNTGFPVMRYQEKVFSEEYFFNADSNVFDVFTIPFVQGDPKTALTKPSSVVITEEIAKKYFGNENPIGKVMNLDNRLDFKVTGVVKGLPKNSHWHFDFLSSMSTYQNSRSTIWLNNNFNTYVVLKERTSWKALNDKINSSFVKYIEPQVLQFTGMTWAEHKKLGTKYDFILQPLTDIHLKSHLQYEIEPNSDIIYVYIFSIIAIGVLGIACFNFMNLSTARALKRAREVGIRKTLGSTFDQLIRQFLSESIVLVTISVVLAIIFVNLLMPILNDVSAKSISLNLIENIKLIPVLIIFILVVGFVAGSYPAFFLASFKPVLVLGGKLKYGLKGKIFRSGLVILQFAISIILIIGTFIVYNQLKYIQTKNLGYNREQLVIIRKVDDIGRFMTPFKEELKRIPNIISLSNSTYIPVDRPQDLGSNAILMNRTGSEGTRLLNILVADYDFAETYQLQMAQGRFYSRDRMVDTVSSAVINEAASKYLNFKEPIGREIFIPDQNNPIALNVIGVVKDFHYQNCREEIRPLLIFLFRSQGFGRYLTVRVHPENIQSTLDNIKNVWHKFAGNQAFEYSYHDQDFARAYQSEQRTGKLFAAFSILGIFIACLGLLGLAAHTAERRTKEIGIRKALGSSIQSILVLLSKEFVKWVLISNIIAWPVAFYMMDKWLQGFAYRIDINLWTFIISGVLALTIALITVSYQAIKAAVANPIDSLRYE
jgi:putative ABC transport system permease protein